jgi:hypothetical protein
MATVAKVTTAGWSQVTVTVTRRAVTRSSLHGGGDAVELADGDAGEEPEKKGLLRSLRSELL